jgi:hypothetical protein
VPQQAKVSSSFCFGFALRKHGDKTANRSEFSRRFAMQLLSADLLCESGEEQKREGAMADEKEEQRKRKYEKRTTPNGRVTNKRRRQTKKNHHPPIMAFPGLALACKWMRK